MCCVCCVNGSRTLDVLPSVVRPVASPFATTGSSEETYGTPGKAKQLGGGNIFAAITTFVGSGLQADPRPLQRFQLGKTYSGRPLPEPRPGEYQGIMLMFGRQGSYTSSLLMDY